MKQHSTILHSGRGSTAVSFVKALEFERPAFPRLKQAVAKVLGGMARAKARPFRFLRPLCLDLLGFLLGAWHAVFLLGEPVRPRLTFGMGYKPPPLFVLRPDVS